MWKWLERLRPEPPSMVEVRLRPQAVQDLAGCPVGPAEVLGALAFGQFAKAKVGRAWRPQEGVEVILEPNGRGWSVWKNGVCWKFRLEARLLCHGPMTRGGTMLRSSRPTGPEGPRVYRYGTNPDVVSALKRLGFNKNEAERRTGEALEQLGLGEHRLEDVIKEALRGRPAA